MARKSGFVRRQGAMRRESLWLPIPFFSNILASSTTASLSATLNAAAKALLPFTVVRVRGQFQCVSDQEAATEQYIGNLGFCVVSDQASAIGVTAIPTPATDLGSDLWFVHESWIGSLAFVTGAGLFSDHPSRHVDSKAMRKVNEDEDIVVVTEAGVGGSGVIVAFVGRFLVKLH